MLLLAVILLLTSIVGADKEPHYGAGRTTMVHLFEWRFRDIAEECEQFLGPYGYGGVQVSPVSENGVIWEPFWNNQIRRPWYERYQPVSYKIATRSGDENDFRDMVHRCNRAGVRIFVDAVINHMTGDLGQGHGTGGSYFDPGAKRYDGVPYSNLDFTPRERCSSGSGNIENYNDVDQVRNCRLEGLNDLDLGKDYVRGKISEFLNRLIDIGVAGFRIDAAKHMWPGDLERLFDTLHNLNTNYFSAGLKPYIFLEVIDMGFEPIKGTQYTHLGRVTEFRFGKSLGDVVRKNFGQQLKYLKNFGEGWAMVPGNDAVTFIDNHDNQRGHGAGGFGSILTHFESRMYKIATAFMLAFPYGSPRIMSSYAWQRNIQGGKDLNDWVGPPHGGNYNTLQVTRNADLTCGNGWICEHRWRQIFNMVKFRNVAGVSYVANWWDNGGNQIAFGRGNRGFIAINNEQYQMNVKLQTGMSTGRYCDVISGSKVSGACTGKYLDVDGSGYAQIVVDNTAEDPLIAIHVESKL